MRKKNKATEGKKELLEGERTLTCGLGEETLSRDLEEAKMDLRSAFHSCPALVQDGSNLAGIAGGLVGGGAVGFHHSQQKERWTLPLVFLLPRTRQRAKWNSCRWMHPNPLIPFHTLLRYTKIKAAMEEDAWGEV